MADAVKVPSWASLSGGLFECVFCENSGRIISDGFAAYIHKADCAALLLVIAEQVEAGDPIHVKTRDACDLPLQVIE